MWTRPSISCCKPNERAEARQFGHVASNQVADLVKLVDRGPGILRELFQADRNSLVGLVDFQDDRFDFVALLQDLGRMIDLSGPGNIGDMDHAIETFFQFDKGAVAGEVPDLAFDMSAGRIFFLSTVPRISFELSQARVKFFALRG